MMITIHRSKCEAHGWERLTPIATHEIPAAAYEAAGRRGRGSVAPTSEEIEAGCRREYESGRDGSIGRIRIDRVQITE